MNDTITNDPQALASAGVFIPGSDAESRAMFIARLTKMHDEGQRTISIHDVLTLITDCDMMARRSAAMLPNS